MAKDKICLDESGFICLNNIYFLGVHQAEEIDEDNFSGIIGLAPGSNPSNYQNKRLPSFIDQLARIKDEKGNNLIDPIFSFFMVDEKQTSKALIGGYDLKKYAKEGSTEADISWHQLNSDTPYVWTVSLSKPKLYGRNPKNTTKIF